MNVISVLTISAAILYLYFTIMVIRTTIFSVSKWLLAACSFCLMYWAFLAYFTYNASDLKHIRLLFQISSSGLILFLPLQNLFLKSLHGRITIPHILTVSLPALIFIIRNTCWDVTFSDFYLENGQWLFVKAEGVWNLLWSFYMPAMVAAGNMFLLLWYRKTTLNREKKQIRLLIISSTITLILSVAEYLFHPFFSDLWTVSISPVLFVPWVYGFVLAIKRYQLFNIVIEDVTRRILESIDELVVLVGSDGKPVYFNRKADEFFRETDNNIRKGNFSILIPKTVGSKTITQVEINKLPLKKILCCRL